MRTPNDPAPSVTCGFDGENDPAKLLNLDLKPAAHPRTSVGLVFSDVRNHLKTLPGFMHLTWWVHPDDPTWYNEVSFWASKEALTDWHMNIYHKNAKEWAARSGAIMEDIITNFELASTRLLRIARAVVRAGISRSI